MTITSTAVAASLLVVLALHVTSTDAELTTKMLQDGITDGKVPFDKIVLVDIHNSVNEIQNGLKELKKMLERCGCSSESSSSSTTDIFKLLLGGSSSTAQDRLNSVLSALIGSMRNSNVGGYAVPPPVSVSFDTYRAPPQQYVSYPSPPMLVNVPSNPGPQPNSYATAPASYVGTGASGKK